MLSATSTGPTRAIVKLLGGARHIDVNEAYGRAGPTKPYPRPAWAGGEAAGAAVTVLAHPGDNWMIDVAVKQCRPGDILVVGCSADNTDGMFGDLLATSLKARGVTGLVIDAGRPVAWPSRCGRADFRGGRKPTPRKGTVKATLGALNVPVVCAGINVEPGDAVIADDNHAFVVVCRKDAAEVVAKGEKRQADGAGEAQAARFRRALAYMYNMREPLAKAGLIYVDKPEFDWRWRCGCGHCSGDHPCTAGAEGWIDQVGSGDAGFLEDFSPTDKGF